MINTKRVFYIYSYKSGRQERNVGFVKIRERDDGYKLNISLKLPTEYAAENVNIYLYKQDEHSLNWLDVGRMNTFSEICKYNSIIDSSDLELNEFNIEEIDGICIISDNHNQLINHHFNIAGKMDEAGVARTFGHDEYIFIAKLSDEKNKIQRKEISTKAEAYVC